MKYADYLTKTPNADPIITSGGGNRPSSLLSLRTASVRADQSLLPTTTVSQSLAQFSTPWVKEFRTTAAFQSWDKVTDPGTLIIATFPPLTSCGR